MRGRAFGLCCKEEMNECCAGRALSGFWITFGGAERQVNDEFGALSDLVLQFYPSTVLSYNLLAMVKANPHPHTAGNAIAGGFGAEEGLKHLFSQGVGNTRSTVLNTHMDS